MNDIHLAAVQLSNEIADLTDQELSKKVLAAMSWEVFEYPEPIPDQTPDGDMITSEVSFFGIKDPSGKTFYKGSPFEEDIYKSVNVGNYHFMGILLKYLADNDYRVDIVISDGKASVEVIHKGDTGAHTKITTGVVQLPRVLCEAFLLNKGKNK
jgi:hypothetical protein